jgi:thiamine biosynthesis protein ThiS
MTLTINGKPSDLPEAATVAQLLAQFDLAGKHVAVEVNREVISRARHAEYRLKAGDSVEIVTLVGGG